MLAYRIYSLKGEHIAGPSMVVNCANDKEAIETAKKMLDKRALEVWESSRRVIRLDPEWEQTDIVRPLRIPSRWI